ILPAGVRRVPCPRRPVETRRGCASAFSLYALFRFTTARVRACVVERAGVWCTQAFNSTGGVAAGQNASEALGSRWRRETRTVKSKRPMRPSRAGTGASAVVKQSGGAGETGRAGVAFPSAPAGGGAAVDVGHAVVALFDGAGDGLQDLVELAGGLVPRTLGVLVGDGGITLPRGRHRRDARLQVAEQRLDVPGGGADVGGACGDGAELVADGVGHVVPLCEPAGSRPVT